MIKQMLMFICAAVILSGAGCAKINPRIDPKLDQKINNQDGKIRDIENFQNGVKSDINGIKQNADLTNSKLDHVQNGLANMNLQSTNQNSGMQVLSGSGGLIVGLFGMAILGFVVLSYRRQAKDNEKIADILASKVVMQGDASMQDDVFKAAMYSNVEGGMLDLIKKHQEKVSSLSLNRR